MMYKLVNESLGLDRLIVHRKRCIFAVRIFQLCGVDCH